MAARRWILLILANLCLSGGAAATQVEVPLLTDGAGNTLRGQVNILLVDKTGTPRVGWRVSTGGPITEYQRLRLDSTTGPLTVELVPQDDVAIDAEGSETFYAVELSAQHRKEPYVVQVPDSPTPVKLADLVGAASIPAGSLLYSRLLPDTATDGQFATWSDSSKLWIPVTVAPGAGVEEAPIDGQQYARQDGAWSVVVGGGGGASDLGDLGDVTLGVLSDNDLLAYDSTGGAWINQDAAAAGLAASVHNHNSTDLADATVYGRNLLTAASAAAQRVLLQVDAAGTDNSPTTFAGLDGRIADVTLIHQGNLTLHTGDTGNPHAVTKVQLGLGAVDNTSDLAKPISTATQAALDMKLTNVIDDTDPYVGGDLKVGGASNYVVVATDELLAERGSFGWSGDPYYGVYMAYSPQGTYDQNDGGILAKAGILRVHGARIEFPGLAHVNNLGNQLYIDEDGHLYGVDPPASGWTVTDSDNGTYDLGTGTGLGAWTQLTGTVATIAQDVLAGDRIDVRIQVYARNKTATRSGVIEVAFGIDGAQPAVGGDQHNIVGAFDGYLPPSSYFSTTHGGLTAGQTVSAWARRISGSHASFGVDLDGTANAHEITIWVPGGGGGGGGDPTNLATIVNPTQVTITSSTGTNATMVSAVNGGDAGILTGADKALVDSALQPADIGTAIGDLVQLANVGGNPGLPAVDGSQLTGLPGPHDPVTLAGVPTYLTLVGQQITRNPIDLATHVVGTLPVTYGGTGVSDLLTLNATSFGSGAATGGYRLTANGVGATMWSAETPTNLGVTYAPTEVTVTSSTGSNVNIAAAVGAGNAGVLTGADKTLINNALQQGDVGTAIGDIVALENVGGNPGLPIVDGSQLTNIPGAHSPVTLAGEGYASLLGQEITFALIDLVSHITGTLPANSGGTGVTVLSDLDADSFGSGVATANQVLTADGLGAASWQTPAGGGGGGAVWYTWHLQKMTDAVTVGAKVRWIAPAAVNISGAHGSCDDAAVASKLTLDVEDGGASIFTVGQEIDVDAATKDSLLAAVQPGLVNNPHALTAGDELVFHVDAAPVSGCLAPKTSLLLTWQ